MNLILQAIKSMFRRLTNDVERAQITADKAKIVADNAQPKDFIVHITGGPSKGYVSDKTPAEISNALNRGEEITGIFNRSRKLNFEHVMGDMAYFTGNLTQTLHQDNFQVIHDGSVMYENSVPSFISIRSIDGTIYVIKVDNDGTLRAV